MFNLAAVALGGAFGSIARYYLSNSTLKHFIFFDMPFAILLVNIIGSFVFGVFMGLIENNILISTSIKTFVLTGFLASFTTFSTFAWESVLFIQNQMYLKLFLYCLLSLILSILFCFAGYLIGK
jgi:CrcB protein